MIFFHRVQAPFVPFLTEHMYQGMRSILDQEGLTNTESVHYLMLPTPTESLIDTKIEHAVSNMQSVINLGRVIRDRNTMPMKVSLITSNKKLFWPE